MFRGVTTLNVDTKGRMAIPARYRERLRSSFSSELVLTVDPDGCLQMFPAARWSEFEDRLNKLPSLDKTTRILRRVFIGHAHEVEMDGQGRILLPPELRRFAGLEKQVALVGQGDKFELWDAETWDSKRGEWLDQVDLDNLELSDELKGLLL